MRGNQLKFEKKYSKKVTGMSEADFLLVSDPGFEGSSLLFNIASSFSDNVVWLAYEPPTMIESILSSYDFRGELRIISSKQYKDYNLVNIMNLNEVSISISKAGENLGKFSLLFTIIPELLLIHGLEKTYLFMLNTIWKIHSQGGTVFALVTKGTQSLKDELVIRRLFPYILRLQKRLTEAGWDRFVVLESPIEDMTEEIIQVDHTGYRIDLPDKFKENIIKTISH